MKKLKSTILTFLFFFGSSYAQERDFNNNLHRPEAEALETASIVNNLDTAVAACVGQNTFWGIDLSSAKEFDLTNNIITYTGNFIPSCTGCYSLAISNNLNGGSVSPTLYSSNNTNACYWNGSSSWIQCNSSTLPGCLCNAAGNNNYLYFHDQNAPCPITKYDGTTYTTIFTINKGSAIADIAADSSGNIYFVSRVGSNADSLYIISPGGQILNQYSLIFDINNAYGCFLLNNVLYIGFGPGNSIYPNMLLPVTISGANAVIGTPLAMPIGLNIADLASCNPGSLLGMHSISDVNEEVSVFPNPVKNKFIISFEQTIMKGNVEMFNIIGEKVLTEKIFNESKKEINLKNISQGIYFVKVFDGEKHYCKKLIIELD